MKGRDQKGAKPLGKDTPTKIIKKDIKNQEKIA